MLLLSSQFIGVSVATVDAENTGSSIVVCCIVFTELLPGNALIKSITLCKGLKDIMNEKEEILPRQAPIRTSLNSQKNQW
jgi:hypothetical protein